MTNHTQNAIEAGAKAWWEARTTINPANDTWDQADHFPEEKEYALKNAQLNIEAALPHLRKMIAEEIRDYWEACGDLIDTHNGARLAFDAIAARIAKGPQQ